MFARVNLIFCIFSHFSQWKGINRRTKKRNPFFFFISSKKSFRLCFSGNFLCTLCERVFCVLTTNGRPLVAVVWNMLRNGNQSVHSDFDYALQIWCISKLFSEQRRVNKFSMSPEQGIENGRRIGWKSPPTTVNDNAWHEFDSNIFFSIFSLELSVHIRRIRNSNTRNKFHLTTRLETRIE